MNRTSSLFDNFGYKQSSFMFMTGKIGNNMRFSTSDFNE